MARNTNFKRPLKWNMTNITWFMPDDFEKSYSDNAFQQSKMLILHLVCSHLPEPSSRDPDTAWNTTEQGWLMKIIWTPFRVSMRNENIWGHICQKPYGSIYRENIYRSIGPGPKLNWTVQFGPRQRQIKWWNENHELTHKNLYRCRWCLLGYHSQQFFLWMI